MPHQYAKSRTQQSRNGQNKNEARQLGYDPIQIGQDIQPAEIIHRGGQRQAAGQSGQPTRQNAILQYLGGVHLVASPVPVRSRTFSGDCSWGGDAGGGVLSKEDVTTMSRGKKRSMVQSSATRTFFSAPGSLAR